MRVGLAVLALAAVFGAVGCGGDDEAEPLTLEQRFFQADDAPGYKPDPEEGGKHTWATVDEFADQAGDQLIRATRTELEEFLRDAGFVRAIGGTRFLGDDGIPDAKGARRVVTAERLEQTGEEGEPHDEYNLLFSDGEFAYLVRTFGPIGEATTEATTEAIAKRVYDRVKGAPPAPGG